MQALSFPNNLRKAQQSALLGLGVDPSDSKTLAAAVKQLSDFYVKHPEKSTPWHETWAKIAYLTYYLPLNWWRACGVISRGQQLNFFNGFDHYLDFGSGLGSVSHAFDASDIKFRSGSCVERHHAAASMHQHLSKESLTPLSWLTEVTAADIKEKTLAIFSYSFTELKDLPSWVHKCDGLMLIEPSTRDDARRLQTLRSQLLQAGWHIWGPCTHSLDCPLLTKSERDWCHDRFLWVQPAWLKAVEDHMPIKNGTLPCSWMMFKKNSPDSLRSDQGRITGDLQQFKGYAKQLVCRGPEREFLSWQKKIFKHYPDIPRGSLVRLDRGVTNKGDELRLSDEGQITLLR